MATISWNGIIKRISLDPSSSFRNLPSGVALCPKSHPIAFGSLHIGMKLKIYRYPGFSRAWCQRGKGKGKIKRVKFALTTTETTLAQSVPRSDNAAAVLVYRLLPLISPPPFLPPLSFYFFPIRDIRRIDSMSLPWRILLPWEFQSTLQPRINLDCRLAD